MKAIHFLGAKSPRLVNVPNPEPGEGQVLVAVKASGICGSDKWLWWNEEPTSYIYGHEIAGEVVALGPGINTLRVGSRVAVNNVVGCGDCPACRRGEFVLCPYWTGAQDVNGGFAEMVVVPERNCLLLNDAIDYITAALIFDNLGTPYHALHRAGVQAGDHVVISGCGPIGLAAVMFAKNAGAEVSALDPLPYRQEKARSLGADAAYSPGSEAAGAIRAATAGLGPRIFIECSGQGAAYPLGLSLLRVGGVLVAVGEHARFELRPSDHLIRKALDLRGSWYSTMTDGKDIQNLILQGKVDPKILVTHTAALRDFPALFEMVCEFGDKVIKAVITE